MAESDNRIVWAITMLGVFSGLIILMGSSFSDIDIEKHQLIDIPDYLPTGDFFVNNITASANGTLSLPSTIDLDIQGDGSEYVRVSWVLYDKSNLRMTHRYGQFLWLWKNEDVLSPYPLTWAEIVDGESDVTNSSTVYMTSPQYQWVVKYYYNTTAYDNLTHAYDNNDMNVWVGQGTENTANEMSAWTLMTSILTWSNPDIHPVINFIIAIPLYATMAVILYRVFTRLIEVAKPL